MPPNERVPTALFDMRLPLTFSLEDRWLIGRIIREVVGEARAQVRGGCRNCRQTRPRW